jgi:formiminoglutamase
MNAYQETNPELWTGRKSGQQLYLHEKVQLVHIEATAITAKKSFALLGYACDEGVKRNQGRKGAMAGPDAIRNQLAKMPNHLEDKTELFDFGSIHCFNGDLEDTQNRLSEKVTVLLAQDTFPIIIGGGHDIAYGHYNGLKKHLSADDTIGVINFDAHFDLRSNENGNNSGTPFFQISQDCKKRGQYFNYLCLGIRKDANDKTLFQTATDLGVHYIEHTKFKLQHAKEVVSKVSEFIGVVDHVYVTIDLDGFSSAYAPGVSAPSPMGFSPDMVLETLQMIIDSQKLLSLDIAEMNPKYDIDNQTAKLAASLIHFVIHSL